METMSTTLERAGVRPPSSMIRHSVSSFLTGHIDVIHASDFRCRVETTRTSLFSKRYQTLIYEITGSDWEVDSRLFAKVEHGPNLHPRVSLGYHKSIVDYLEGWEGVGDGVTLEEAVEMMSVCFGEFGEWKVVKPNS